MDVLLVVRATEHNRHFGTLRLSVGSRPAGAKKACACERSIIECVAASETSV
jgi:hypothetical protein